MRMRIERLLIGFFILGLLACKKAHILESKFHPIVEKTSTKNYWNTFPKPVGFVNDFGNIFTTEQKQILEKELVQYEQKTNHELVIITVDSITPYSSIKDFSTDLSNHWGIGKKDTNNGLAIVFSQSLKEIRISTGTGTEKVLTNAFCKKVIDNVMIPEFKNKDYYKGIKKGIEELMLEWY